MPDIISDDMGSFPLPEGVNRREIESIALEIITGNPSEKDRENFSQIVSEIMNKKIESGLMRPNYPQIRDMISSFSYLIENFYEEKEPWMVKKEFALIPEISTLDNVAKKYFESKGKSLKIRVCFTGPMELYLKKVGNQIQGDLLLNLAKSISRFIENSILDKNYIKTRLICIDEPSLGINPNVIAEDEDLIKAWEISVKNLKRLDVQLHLHSINDLDRIYQVDGIKILGIESAEYPRNLELIDKSDLELYDKFLRVGISRTNINGMIAEFNDRFKIDLWKEKNFNVLMEKMENSRIIEKRLSNAWKIFNDRIKYAGPDCGLGSWPNQEIAFQLLKNTIGAINNFNKTNI